MLPKPYGDAVRSAHQRWLQGERDVVVLSTGTLEVKIGADAIELIFPACYSELKVELTVFCRVLDATCSLTSNTDSWLLWRIYFTPTTPK